MTWLVIGASGMLGSDLTAVLSAAGQSVRGIDRDTLDITDQRAVDETVIGYDVVVNCAAYTAVDAAEADESTAFLVNGVGPANLARAAERTRARLVQISTDYVFDGAATSPYAEDAPELPRTAYGRTKLAGEWAVRSECRDHLIVRTAWLYGAGGACFPRTIARLLRERGTLDVVDDQRGQPTWTVDLAELIVRLVAARAPSGTYHGTSSGDATWCGFARDVASAIGLDPAVVRPSSSAGSARAAARPAYSALGHGRLDEVGVAPIGDWRARWAAAAETVLTA